MKTIIRLIIAALVAIVAIGVGGAYLIPAETVVQRQAVINAPPEKVFAIVGDLRRFKEWSPWADLDPNLQYTFEGPETGVGQKMSWVSEKPDVGARRADRDGIPAARQDCLPCWTSAAWGRRNHRCSWCRSTAEHG